MRAWARLLQHLGLCREHLLQAGPGTSTERLCSHSSDDQDFEIKSVRVRAQAPAVWKCPQSGSYPAPVTPAFFMTLWSRKPSCFSFRIKVATFWRFYHLFLLHLKYSQMGPVGCTILGKHAISCFECRNHDRTRNEYKTIFTYCTLNSNNIVIQALSLFAAHVDPSQ